MEHAIDNPTATPVGCTRLLYGAYDTFTGLFSQRMAPYYANIFALIMVLVTHPRSPVQMRQLEISTNICRCRTSTSPVVPRHGAFNTWIHTPEYNTYNFLFAKVIGGFMTALTSNIEWRPTLWGVRFYDVVHERHARRRRINIYIPFSRSPQENFPFGSIDSIKTTINWHYVNEHFLDSIEFKGEIGALLVAML
jgi:hypothetical protein